MNKKVLIFGVSGMLGSCLLSYFRRKEKYDVFGTIRSPLSDFTLSSEGVFDQISSNDLIKVDEVISKIRPQIVINCIGVVKQLEEAGDHLITIPINSLFPHQLAQICNKYSGKLIHISTDCVFSGSKGMYKENDLADARDLYGLSKKLGEVIDSRNLTLRTSIIGHELNSTRSLVDWFLSQNIEIQGYKNAIFSGLPTIEIARIIEEFIIDNESLTGLYHVSSEPINKFDLLNLIAKEYDKVIKIIANEEIKIDRSLDSSRFREHTGFHPDNWEQLVKKMRSFSV